MNQVYDVHVQAVRKKFLQTDVAQTLRRLAERLESGDLELEFGDSIVVTANPPKEAT